VVVPEHPPQIRRVAPLRASCHFGGMDPFTFFTTTEGRLARQPFWLALIAIYLLGFLSQLLLIPDVIARLSLSAFAAAQAALLWFWLVIHVKRLRDAGEGGASAIGVALIYALCVGLLVMLIAFLTNPNDVGVPNAPATPADQAVYGFFLMIVIFGLLLSPDVGIFTLILKLLVLIACLPVLISFGFSLVTGLRPSKPPVAPAP
jgi:uncharacterized membrane protein YhaH (DUF805 family)